MKPLQLTSQKKQKQMKQNMEENEYGITGLNINSVVPDSKILKIENEKEQKKISEEIQELIKAYKEPDLTLTVSNTEPKTIKISFVKKNESDLPKKNIIFQSFNR